MKINIDLDKINLVRVLWLPISGSINWRVYSAKKYCTLIEEHKIACKAIIQMSKNKDNHSNLCKGFPKLTVYIEL